MKQKGLAPLVIIILIALAVGGYLLYQKQLKPAVPQPSVNPVASPVPTGAGETANWKTYSNNELNIVLKYPPTWDLSEVKSEEGKTKPFYDVFELKPQSEKDKANHYGIKFRYYNNPQKLSLVNFEKEFGINIEGKGNCGIYLPDDIPVKNNNGVSGFYRAEGICEPLEAEFYNWSHKDKIFQLIDSKMFNVQADEVLEQIFSSFKFTQ